VAPRAESAIEADPATESGWGEAAESGAPKEVSSPWSVAEAPEVPVADAPTLVDRLESVLSLPLFWGSVEPDLVAVLPLDEAPPT
jgi:hypothetical protein